MEACPGQQRKSGPSECIEVWSLVGVEAVLSIAYEWRLREGVGSLFTAPLAGLPPHSGRPAAKALSSSQAKQKESYITTV